MQACYRLYELPWTLSAETERRFRKITLHVFGVLAAMALIMPWLPTSDLAHQGAPTVPPRLAKLVLERKAAPPPPPAPVVREEIVEPTPAEPPAVEPEQRREPEPVAPPAKVEPERAPERAREKAAHTGVMAFADQLAELRRHTAVELAAGPRALGEGVGAASRSERSLVSAGAGAGSGGINDAALSRNTGGSALGGRTVTQVAAPVATSAPRSGVAGAASGDSREAQRSREEIELVFDRNKGAIYALYHRALREDPSLAGKLVLRLTIAPSGRVVDCAVVSSELGSPELERKLVQRVKMFDFGARDVAEITTTKPIEFFPA